MLTNYTLSFYNGTLKYRQGEYAIIEETLSNSSLSEGLTEPTRHGHVTSRLIANIEGFAFS